MALRAALVAALFVSLCQAQTYRPGQVQIPIAGPLRSYVAIPGRGPQDGLRPGPGRRIRQVHHDWRAGHASTYQQHGSDGLQLSGSGGGGGTEDGVLTTAVYDSSTKMIALTTTKPESFTLNLSALANSSEIAATIADWAEAGDVSIIPVEKLAGGGVDGQVLTRTASGQAWEDAADAGTDDQTAAEVPVTASGFSGNLGATDTNVQTALETIDGFTVGGGAADGVVQAGTYASGSIVLDRTIGADVTITGIPQPGTDDQTATEVSTSTTNFGNNLGTGDTTVQAALDTLDDLTISGGGGTPLAVTTADIANITFTEGLTAEIDPAAINTAVDTGIAVPANTKTILVNYGASTDAATAGRDLLWFPMPIEEWERLDGVDVGDTPTQGNARFTRIWRDADITAVGAVMARQVWLGKGNNGNIFVWSDNTAWDIYPFRARFEIHEPLTVVTDVTGGGGGGGGTADGVVTAGTVADTTLTLTRSVGADVTITDLPTLDIAGLPNQSSTQLADNDVMAVENVSESPAAFNFRLAGGLSSGRHHYHASAGVLSGCRRRRVVNRCDLRSDFGDGSASDPVALSGEVPDGNIPAGIARDSELPTADQLVPAGGVPGDTLKRVGTTGTEFSTPVGDGVVESGEVTGTTLTLRRTQSLADVTITGLPQAGEATNDGVVNTLAVAAQELTATRSEGLDPLRVTLPFEIILPDSTTGHLPLFAEADLERVSNDHGNICTVRREILNSGTLLSVTTEAYSATGYRGVRYAAPDVGLPQPNDTMFAYHNRRWYQWNAILQAWVITSGPSGWVGAWDTEDAAEHAVTAVGDTFYADDDLPRRVQRVTAYTAPAAADVDYACLPEPAILSLQNRPLLPAPDSTNIGEFVEVNAAGDGYVTAAVALEEEIYAIPPDDITQVGDLITMANIPPLTDGLLLYFTAEGANTAGLTLSIEGTTYNVLKSAGASGAELFEGGEIENGLPLQLVYDNGEGTFYWFGTVLGSAARRDVGTEQNELVALNDNGRISSTLLGENPVVGYSLSHTATGPAWTEEVSGGGGGGDDAYDWATEGNDAILIPGLKIPDLDAAKIVSGTFDRDRIPFDAGTVESFTRISDHIYR